LNKDIKIAISITLVIIISFVLFGDAVDSFYKELTPNSNSGNNRVYLSILFFAFLVIDIFLPIPSTIVMTEAANALGMLNALLISVMGLTFSNIVGFSICRFGLKKNNDNEVNSLTLFFDKHAFFCIILTRSIPILPELIACMSGFSSMKFSHFAIASLLGAIPIAAYCSYIGMVIEGREYQMFYAIAFSGIMMVFPMVYRIIYKKA
jgi:uncharacterized membrane protein YdjX (TVP38/TMEM64 family)